MELYILRHGETDWNKTMRMQGQVNIPLNDYGRELAEKTRDGLKDIKFDYIFSSPLDRALETAKIVTGVNDDEITKDERLLEISFGEYEGKYPDERPAEFLDFFKAPDKYVPGKGAESYQELCKRTAEFVKEIINPIEQIKPDAKVLISGHGAMNKSLMLYFKRLEIKDIWSGPFQKNCSVTKVDVDSELNYTIAFENKVFYEEKEYKPLWLVKRIAEDDYGCEERTEKEQTFIVYVESEKGEKKEIKLTDSFLDKNGILEGRYINHEILFGDNTYLQ